ncbi:hypothetical protein I6A84_05135 [Frankia sp. CNm7]|uniref:Uncharacterized protein n=1 Tax=Frankia nepalensis TaxID=1836974 RepID=A0A937UKH0_9ACTN|nr:hypothetical protein [Frankia nepalensis]MBL7495531.1 hypothetical protein [Frankia nepalensis]MBL7509812.1 hypothetical protein [Frankia nepalensis]MBL7517523.1 hypothetical protein [Frankia nepalensis]MBL7626804.1 hypothetical protein [Frankia nepalensis]
MADCPWQRAESKDQDFAGGPGRPLHVYDHEGTHLGSFAAWETAHEWAHLQVALTSLPGPLEIEDRRRGTRRRVWADHCEPFPAAAPHTGAQHIGAPHTDTQHTAAHARDTHTLETHARDTDTAARAGGPRARATTPTPPGLLTTAPEEDPAAGAKPRRSTATVTMTTATTATPGGFTPPRPRDPS